VGVLKALGETVTSRETVLGLLRKLNERLAGEPEVIQKTQWAAYCSDCKTDFETTNGKRGKKNGIVLRGQNRFPQENGGAHRSQIECPNCGTQ
jgi:DNA-directed RNA polymerase subunit RPC12/RpoP